MGSFLTRSTYDEAVEGNDLMVYVAGRKGSEAGPEWRIGALSLQHFIWSQPSSATSFIFTLEFWKMHSGE